MGGCASGTEDKKPVGKAESKQTTLSKATTLDSKKPDADASPPRNVPPPSMLDEFPEVLPGESINPKRRVEAN
jgi:hypothetical protein